MGHEFYTMALANAARLDLCEYFTECLNESARLLNKATEIMLKKGTYIRTPFIPIPKKVEYVQNQSYLAGLFGHARPLNAIEIYVRLTSEVLNFAKDGTDIQSGWLEQPPQAADRDKLVKSYSNTQ